MEKFTDISGKIASSTGVEFEEVSDLEAAKADVRQSKAFAVINITADGFDYFRSEFNEPVGGEIIRSMFLQLSDSYENPTDEVMVIENNMNIKKTTSKIYYTFAAAAFLILFMAFPTSMSIIEEKELGTDIRISSTGSGGVLLAKALTSICGGIAEIIIIYLYSAFVIGVEWGGNLPLNFLLSSGKEDAACKNETVGNKRQRGDGRRYLWVYKPREIWFRIPGMHGDVPVRVLQAELQRTKH